MHTTNPVMSDEINGVWSPHRNFMYAVILGALSLKHNLNINKDKCSEFRTGVNACTLQIKPVVTVKLNPPKHL